MRVVCSTVAVNIEFKGLFYGVWIFVFCAFEDINALTCEIT